MRVPLSTPKSGSSPCLGSFRSSLLPSEQRNLHRAVSGLEGLKQVGLAALRVALPKPEHAPAVIAGRSQHVLRDVAVEIGGGRPQIAQSRKAHRPAQAAAAYLVARGDQRSKPAFAAAKSPVCIRQMAAARHAAEP